MRFYIVTMMAMPIIVTGPLLALGLGVGLRWLPVAGWEGPPFAVLPVLALGLGLSAPVARLSRAGLREVVSSDFVRAARSRGVSGWILLVRHLWRGGLIPLAQYLGPVSAALLTGTFVVEQIFWIPGLGKAFVNSVFNRDYPLQQGVILVYLLFLMGANLLSDLATAWMDPRARTAEGGK